ncbi:hypothetical protein JKP88DRAFT_34649 [Tribonema minus]|uniref:Uncharacterized protein n=1 Tax=Tribonema minus TaxID=303371 RepID=A0A836CI97_9STRA|nr:hypothetical protein JKP88DRAFT_34649 [Tribonema minus]
MNSSSEDKTATLASGCCLGVFVLTGWIMAVTGTAIAYDDCDSYCSDKYRNAWWSVCYHAVIYLVLLTLAVGDGLASYKTTMMGFFVLAAAQLTWLSNDVITAANACWAAENVEYYSQLTGYGDFGGCSDGVQAGISVAAAGFVLLVTCDYVLIVVLGYQPQASYSSTTYPEGQPGKTVADPYSAAPAANVGM